jgi:hypothetical protein
MLMVKHHATSITACTNRRTALINLINGAAHIERCLHCASVGTLVLWLRD